jgi:pimeloyl-ACP methyl ester carboxylesterase
MQKTFFCLAILIAVWQSLFAQQKSVPRFEADKCAVDVPKGERVDCGYLVVPESRSFRSSRTIRLPIIVLKSDSPDPKPDAVLRTLGGPGGSSLRMVTGRRFSPWLKQRDMIIFEQRGTRYAQPSLGCPEVDEANIASAKTGLSRPVARKNEVAAAARCYQRLSGQGIDLSAYNSYESAADIEDLRKVLGLKAINLYGVSYSARLMLEFVRDYPASVRSLVIESTMPVEANYDETGVDNIARSLDLFFARCKGDPNCNGTYPDLETGFYALADRWNKRPVEIKTKDASGGEANIKIDGDDLITWLVDYVLSSDGRAITAAPQQIALIAAGKYEPLADYAQSKLGPAFYSWGMRYSVWCTEEFPFESKQKIAAQGTKFERLRGYQPQALPDICRVWKVRPRPPAENSPVSGSVPLMVLAGEFDAYTPPAWGKATADRFPGSFYFDVPWVGHGPGFNSPSCLGDMVAAFIDDPKTAPDAKCLTKIRDYFKFPPKS